MIKVNDKEISFDLGMTVADAIKASGAEITQMTIVLVNGRLIALDIIDVKELTDSTNIKILALLSGG